MGYSNLIKYVRILAGQVGHDYVGISDAGEDIFHDDVRAENLIAPKATEPTQVFYRRAYEILVHNL